MPPKFKKPYDERSAAPERQALLENQSDDDDFFLRGPAPRLDQISRLEEQVDEVAKVMQDNIGKVVDRGDRLEVLQDKTDMLSSTADEFHVKAKMLNTNMWWRECKMRIILGTVIFIIVLIIVVPIIIKQTQKP